MSGSKLTLYGIGSALFRTLPTRTLFPFSHHRRRSFSSAAATGTLSSVDQQHPWPEWVSFVDTLNTKGYLTKPDDTVYVNINLLKDACLSFARHRYDLFKLLPLKDIQGVVEGGCPNLLQEAINSAKRLRVHMWLDEGDVCSACNLRNSCDKAYVIQKEFEADARTVDIVRIVLFYALDPLVLSGGDKPPGREAIESSVRNLLSQLIELSELSPAPDPTFTPVHLKPTSQDAVARAPLNFMTNKLFEDVEMMKGYWMCPKCSFPNFFRNLRCLKCETEEVERHKEDYKCPHCGFMNCASNVKCLCCCEPRPKKQWSCPKCEFMNFAHKKNCLRCLQSNPSPMEHVKLSTIMQEMWLA